MILWTALPCLEQMMCPAPGTPGAWHSNLAGSDDGMLVAIWDAYPDAEREDGTGTAVYLSTSSDYGLTGSKAERVSAGKTSAHHPRTLKGLLK